MQTVTVRNLKIGDGKPKICVSIIGKDKTTILAEAKILAEAQADIAEWRVDCYTDVMQTEQLLQTAEELRKVLGEIPLLLTFRTANEGGKREITKEAYEHLLLAVSRSRKADMVDVEIFMGEETAGTIIQTAHENGVKVIASNHDFDKTPEKQEIIRRLCLMQKLGADIAKIAVMPNSKTDVAVLLTATAEMYERYAKGPIVTMSMSKQGVISRICGECFGSAMTFGAIQTASAPGQVEIVKLRELLALMQEL